MSSLIHAGQRRRRLGSDRPAQPLEMNHDEDHIDHERHQIIPLRFLGSSTKEYLPTCLCLRAVGRVAALRADARWQAISQTPCAIFLLIAKR